MSEHPNTVHVDAVVVIRERKGPECLMEDATITVGGETFDFSRRTAGDSQDTQWSSAERLGLNASRCEARILESGRRTPHPSA